MPLPYLVSSHIIIDEKFSSSDRATILGFLDFLYDKSTIMAGLLDSLAPSISSIFGKYLTVNYLLGKAEGKAEFFNGVFGASITGGTINFDLDYIKNLYGVDPENFGYFNQVGEFHTYELVGIFAHELIHALTGKTDGPTGGEVPIPEVLKSLSPDLYGDTVRLENSIRAQLGFPDRRIGYVGVALKLKLGDDASGSVTRRQTIDNVVVENGPTGSVLSMINLGESRDLVFGLQGNDTILGGSGHDYLYAGVGNDVLVGGAGNDLLDGGSDVDTVAYRWKDAALAINEVTDHGVAIDGSGPLPSDLPARFVPNKVIVVRDDGDGGTDVIYDIEKIILPGVRNGTTGPAPAAQVNTIITTDANRWGNVTFSDSAGTNQNDIIQLRASPPPAPPAGGGTAPTPPAKQGLLKFNYDLADDVRNAGLKINIDAATSNETRLNNALFINGKQVLGGVLVGVNQGDWAKQYNKGVSWGIDLPATASTKQIQDMADKETAKRIEAMISSLTISLSGMRDVTRFGNCNTPTQRSPSAHEHLANFTRNTARRQRTPLTGRKR
jgi:hypothetical protein